MFFLFICNKCRRVKFLASPPQSRSGRCRECTVYVGPVTHGEAGYNHKRTKLYRAWGSMLERCYNGNARSYPRYGGRGISVCNEWRHNFVNFRDWANENGYTPGLQIDRIDNDGNYEPSNCRWVTAEINCQNRGSGVLSPADAAAIKGLLLIGYRQKEVYKSMGLRKHVVASIAQGKTWENIQPSLESTLYV